MLNKPKILCVILARGGSKAIPGKNIKHINGHPLIAYTIIEALQSKYIDRVIVSSDSKEIKEQSIKYWKELGYEICGDNRNDFLEDTKYTPKESYDMIITNVPFQRIDTKNVEGSLKYQIIKKIFLYNKNFDCSCCLNKSIITFLKIFLPHKQGLKDTS